MTPADDPDRQPAPSTDATALRLRRLAGLAAVAVSAILAAAKLGAWLVTDSVALLSSLMDSVLDVAAAVVALTTLSHALRPADRGHRYGHGKVESLGALAQMAFIAGSGVLILFKAVDRLIEPEPLEATTVGLVVMGFSACLTLVLVLFQRRAVRRTGSLGIAAIALNYRGDLLMNLSVIAALVAYEATGSLVVDPLTAMAIAVYMLWNAWRIGHDCLDVLMDRELPPADRAAIRTIVLDHPLALGVHDIRTRSAGSTRFIELHLELDGTMTLQRAHDVTDDVERALKAAFPDAEVIVHQEPQGLDDDRLDNRVGEAPPA